MTRSIAANQSVNSEDMADSEKVNVFGKKIWRVLPYIRPYRKRAMTGVISNGLARASDLLPFVFIGYAVDYYSSGARRGPVELLELIHGNLAISYGILIFLGFASLAMNVPICMTIL